LFGGIESGNARRTFTVDFPDPLGPRKPKMEPFAIENETRSTAVKCPNRRVRFSHSIMGSAGMIKSGLEKR